MRSSPSATVCLHPKDRERERFACRTRRCRAKIQLVWDASGNAYVASAPAHDHPDHAEWIATLRHIKALNGEATSEQNRHVSTRTVASRVRAETGTARRRSADIRYVRRKRMLGNQPRCGTRSSSPRASRRTQSTSRTTSRSSFLHGTGLFGSRLSRPACASTERSGRSLKHTSSW